MDASDQSCVVYSDNSTGDPLTVTLASDYEKSQEKTQVNWTMTATQLFIASWVTRKELFRKMPAKDVYGVISKDLKEMGYDYSGEQCSIKWRSLKASFLKSKLTQYHRDRPSNWVHYQAMAEALDEQDSGHRRHKVESYVSNNPGSDDDDNDGGHMSPRNSPPPSPPPIKRRRGRPPKSLQMQQYATPVKKIVPVTNPVPVKTMTEEKGSEFMKCFNRMQEEWQTRREERQRMHDKRMELGRKKLRVMEELISILKKK